MHVSSWNVAFQTLNFLVLAWLLHRFLWKPVRRILTARQDEVGRRIREAEEEKARADALGATHQAELAGMTAEAETERERVRREAKEEAARIREDAERKARELASRTRDELAQERQRALRELTSRAAELALVVAERLLREAAPGPDDRFALRAIESIDAMDATKKAVFRRGLTERGVEIVCAHDLDESARVRLDAWVAGLAGGAARTTYTVDPELIAGVELRFPDAVFRSNLRTSLARVREELADHGAAA